MNIFRRKEAPAPTPDPEPDTELLRPEFGGREDCAHEWLERVNGALYHGPRVQASPYVIVDRCLACGRIWGAVSVVAE